MAGRVAARPFCRQQQSCGYAGRQSANGQRRRLGQPRRQCHQQHQRHKSRRHKREPSLQARPHKAELLRPAKEQHQRPRRIQRHGRFHERHRNMYHEAQRQQPQHRHHLKTERRPASSPAPQASRHHDRSAADAEGHQIAHGRCCQHHRFHAVSENLIRIRERRPEHHEPQANDAGSHLPHSRLLTFSNGPAAARHDAVAEWAPNA